MISKIGWIQDPYVIGMWKVCDRYRYEIEWYIYIYLHVYIHTMSRLDSLSFPGEELAKLISCPSWAAGSEGNLLKQFSAVFVGKDGVEVVSIVEIIIGIAYFAKMERSIRSPCLFFRNPCLFFFAKSGTGSASMGMTLPGNLGSCGFHTAATRTSNFMSIFLTQWKSRLEYRNIQFF